MTTQWYRVLLSLFNRTGLNPAGGGSNTAIVDAVGSAQNGVNTRWFPTSTPPPLPQYVSFYKQINGEEIGGLYLGDVPSSTPYLPIVGVSPYVLTWYGGSGTLFVYNAAPNAIAVEISADAGATYYPVSKDGGAVPINFNDYIRLTWAAGVPSVVFFGHNLVFS